MNKFSITFICLLLSACSANTLNNGAERVRVTHNEPGKECTYLGDITGNQGNFFTGSWTSNQNLETGARNSLKNEAHKIGGNVVAILTQRAGQTGGVHEGTGSSRQTNVTITGNVYRCP